MAASIAKTCKTMVSHAHSERKLSTRSSLRSWLCHTALGIAVKAPRAWPHYFSVNDLRPADRNSLSLTVPGLGLTILLSAE
jgi:hypothetical protein